MQLHRLVGIFALALAATMMGPAAAWADDPKPGSSSLLGGDPSTWTPIAVTPSNNGTQVTASLGQALVLTGFPETSVVQSSNTAVATPIQGTTTDATTVDGVTTPGVTTHPGLQTHSVGATLIVVLDGPVGASIPITRFVVQVANASGRQSMLDRAPIVLDGTETSLTMNETGEQIAWDFDKYSALSDNEMVMTSIGSPARRTFTTVGYGTARITISQAGKKVARVKVTVTRGPRFEFRIDERLITSPKAGQIVNVTGRLAQPLPSSAVAPKVCAFHVTPRVRLGCNTVSATGGFTIPAKARAGTAVVEYKASGGGKGSAFFAIEINRPA